MSSTTGWRRGGWTIALGAIAAALAGCFVGPPPVTAEGPYPEGQPPPPVEGQPPPVPQVPQPPQPPQPDAAPAPGGDDVAVDDFVAPLSHYGTWVDVAPYGRVWQPAEDVAGEDFTPYASDGAWAANDDGSWVFQSRYDGAWGWATYHYGRWVEHPEYGWVWVPGTVWAPSWVEWRHGGGYVGWVPMGPPGVVVVQSRWVFVEERNLTAPAVLGYRLPPERAHVAFAVAAPIVDVRGSAHWTVGPSVARLSAAGAAIRTAHVVVPARGYVRAQASAVAHIAAATRPARVQSMPTIRRGPSAVHIAAQPQPMPVPVAHPSLVPAVAPIPGAHPAGVVPPVPRPLAPVPPLRRPVSPPPPRGHRR